MISFSDYKKHLVHGESDIGKVYRDNSNMILEQTWNRDIQSKKCYIYDYYHDDKPWKNERITHENTTKTPIDAKFIITQGQSIDKDRVAVMLQFKPSQKFRFEKGDDLYYYEREYKNKYNSNFPIGMYCDIPDENGDYYKWIICAKQTDNQFVKYLILPANYRFSWVETEGNNRIIRRVWGATRSQNSYNSGLWTAYYTTEIENQFKAILPMNPITEKIFYTNDANQNQRFIISAMTFNPRSWQVSKVEDMLMGEFGLVRLTFIQVAFNKDVDYIEYNALNPDGSKDVYAMYANYYDSYVAPSFPTNNAKDEDNALTICNLKATTNSIKVGGSYKTISAIFSKKGDDVTDKYLHLMSKDSWRFYIENDEIVDKELVAVLEHTDANKIKIRFSNDYKYLGKVLIVRCIVGDILGEMSLDIVNL